MNCRLFGILLSLVLIASTASAQNLLLAPGFEVEAGEVPGWTLDEFRTGDPGNLVNSAQLVGFANSDFDLDPGTGLWLRSFVGNPDDGTAEAILTQTVPATPGETYSFSGEAEFEQNYAGGVATLDPLSSSGAVPSPTQSLFELAFLDAGGAVIGTPVVRDVASETFNGFGYAAISPVTDVAPANAAEVRVRAIGSQLIANIDPGQSAFYDNFSLTTTSAPGVELLTNGGLNDSPASAEDVYEFIDDPMTSNTVQLAGFANDPATGGSTGAWVRPFEADGVAATVAQTIAGSVGETYKFTASARWEVNYLGDGSLTDENETLIELSFLDEGGEVIDSAVLDLRDDGKTADNEWSTHMVSAVAPEGTIDVRVAGIVNNLTNNEENPGAQSAFWDDFVLETVGDDPLFGDFEPDGDVDIIDFGAFADAFGSVTGDANYDPLADSEPDGDVDIIDFGLFADNFGIGTASAVPEPMTAGMLLVALLAAPRRRG